jgi:hypothetical protein
VARIFDPALEFLWCPGRRGNQPHCPEEHESGFSIKLVLASQFAGNSKKRRVNMGSAPGVKPPAVNLTDANGKPITEVLDITAAGKAIPPATQQRVNQVLVQTLQAELAKESQTVGAAGGTQPEIAIGPIHGTLHGEIGFS